MKAPLLSSLLRLRWALAVLALVGLVVVAALVVPGRLGVVTVANKQTNAVTEATGQGTAEDTPTEDTPTEDTPAEDTPAEDTPAEDTPAEDTPAEDTPAEDTPAEDTPALATTTDPTAPIVPTRNGSPDTVTNPPVEGSTEYNTLFGIGESRRVQFHNRSEKTVSVAVLVHSPDMCGGEGLDWRTAGWWNLEPGETKYVLRTSNAYIAYYAVSDDGQYVWPPQRQAGLTKVYVSPDSAFDHCLGLGATFWDVVRMKTIKVGSGDAPFTLHLNAPV